MAPPLRSPLPRRAAFRGHDVEFAVGLQEHVAGGLAKDDPPAVGRILGKVIAHAVARRARQRLGLPALAAVESNAVQVELERLAAIEELGAFLGVQQYRLTVGHPSKL